MIVRSCLQAELILAIYKGGLFLGLVLYLSFFTLVSDCKSGRHCCSDGSLRTDTTSVTSISTFFAAAELSGAFPGLLAAAIVNIDGLAGKQGWAWIFILVSVFRCTNYDGRINLFDRRGFLLAYSASSRLPSSLVPPCTLPDRAGKGISKFTASR
jgi:hypothetical protein